MKVAVTTTKPKQNRVEMLSYLLFEGDKLRHVLPKTTLQRSEFSGKKDQTLFVENVDGFQTLGFIGLGKKADFNLLSVRNAVASAMRFAFQKKVESAAFVLPSYTDMEELGKESMLGAALGQYAFLKYKTDEHTKKLKKTQEVVFIVEKRASDFQKGTAIGSVLAEGVFLSRDLVNDPASNTTTQTLVDVAKTFKNIFVKVLEENECKKLGMGSYLAVAKGSVVPPKFIVLHYKPKSAKGKKIALIGKSIMFDSGGLSIKPAQSMEDMKIDMSGGASVLGVFKVLSDLGEKAGVNSEVFGILPACENMPSGNATRPGDIVTALNGKTIEVLNTDAEGRLTLADALVYAEKHCKAEVLIDLATLTGACMVALGGDLAGMFTNNEQLGKKFQDAADKTGDELWPLPLYMPYLKKMKSDIADLKNIGGGRYGGAITAAVFLSEFVDNAQWIHCDIAGPANRNDEPKGALGKGATGWGVLSLFEFIQKV